MKIYRYGSWRDPKPSIYKDNEWKAIQNEYTRRYGIWRWTWTRNRWFTADRSTNNIYEVDPIEETQSSFSTGRDMESIACKGEQLYMLDWFPSGVLNYNNIVYKIDMNNGIRTEIADLPNSVSTATWRIGGTKDELFYIMHESFSNSFDLYKLGDNGVGTKIKDSIIAIDSVESPETNDFLTGTDDDLWILSGYSQVKQYTTTGTLITTYSIPTGKNIRAIAGSKDTLYGLSTDGFVFKLLRKSDGSQYFALEIEELFAMDGRFNYLAIQKT